ncbi:hypothetical protein ASD8599_00225 [Ascidiaceihabitans donghaensis]|uniref:HTH cro/C1-type domain-containing protein n=1 Tax=Ascidiaceihabitans donghaensis TaxID=1510460 RepID=A0A2R8B8U9_9RHOB|nr:helix-turn-helix domain-containing protein [Ascidiaceihabitans donghaensis]SPH19500.1 hypothetical protein ASD8599_00225 [Ascidiaceihabitans donghaensis]
MGINKELMGPVGPEDKEAFAIESLVFSVQVSLQKIMNKRGVNNKDLAERLGMTPARVSQIFSSNGPNLTVKTIAKIVHALGDEFEFVPKQDIRSARVSERVAKFKPMIVSGNPSIWKEQPANDAAPRKKMAA